MSGKLLFVEDHLGLIEEPVQLLFRIRDEGVQVRFAQDAYEAIARLQQETFDVVVLDVMLPGIEGVPPDDEGLYLAAWILGETEKLPPSLREQSRPIGDVARPRIIFLSSRTADICMGVFKDLVRGANNNVTFVERLCIDACEQAKMILEAVDAVTS